MATSTTSTSTMVEVGSDGGLVLGTLAGDRATFAAFYDRFATPVHDLHLALLRDPRLAEEATYRTFEQAVAQLKQLGEPGRVRTWLCALAYRRHSPHRRRGRPAPAAARPTTTVPDPDDPQAALWRLAPPGSTSLDRALITLCLRHGMGYGEVARVVGLSVSRAHARMSVIRPWCDAALRTLLAPADCADADGDARADVGPAADDTAPLGTAVPPVPPPPEVRDRVLRDVRLVSAHEGLPRPRTRTAWVGTGLVALLLVTGTALLVRHNLERAPAVAISFGPASELTLSTTVLDLGVTGSTGTVTLSNTGSRELTWRATPADPWLTVTPAAGALTGGTAQPLAITVDRAALVEGDGHSRLTVAGAGDRAEVAVALRHERPPTIVSARASTTTIGGYGCPGAAEVTAVVRDESTPLRVTLVGPGHQSQVMKGDGEVYTGRLGSGADIAWKVVATDARNNITTSTTQVITHADCAARPPPRPVVRSPAAARGGGPAATGSGTTGSGTTGSGGVDDAGPATVPGEGAEEGATSDSDTSDSGSGAAPDDPTPSRRGSGTTVDSSGGLGQGFSR